jgi:hypothetical protein
MPRFDKTGPNGEGPLSGMGLGPCNPEGQQPVYDERPRLGLRRNLQQGFSGRPGRGWGRGRRKGFRQNRGF